MCEQQKKIDLVQISVMFSECRVFRLSLSLSRTAQNQSKEIVPKFICLWIWKTLTSFNIRRCPRILLFNIRGRVSLVEIREK